VYISAGDSKYEGRESLNKKIYVYVGDITQIQSDAIVCSTQTDLLLPLYGCKLNTKIIV